MPIEKQLTVEPIANLYDRWAAYQKRRHENPEEFGLISTGLKSLDTLLDGGVEPGQYVVIAGPPKGAKTTLALNVAKAFAKQGKSVLWCGAEMSNIQMASMLLSNVSKIPRKKIRSIQLEEADWQTLEKAAESIRKFRSYFCHGIAEIDEIQDVIQTVEDLQSKTLDAVFIDYLQLLSAPGVKGGRVQEIEYLSRNMKYFTGKDGSLRIVVVLSQLNRESVRSELWKASSFLGSGAMERDMDVGLIVHDKIDELASQKKPDPTRKVIEIVGSRETETGTCTVHYDGTIALFADATEEKIHVTRPYVNTRGF